MKSTKHNLARDVAFPRAHWDVSIRVPLRPYVRFCTDMDEQLQSLVDKWAHTAAPNAMRPRRRSS